MNGREEISLIEERVLYGLGTFSGLGIVIVFSVLDDWRKTFIAILWALACLAVGHLFGFLFGIPRVLKGGSSTPQVNPSQGGTNVTNGSIAEAAPYEVNTNLQDISDWLTKIIVGLGLVELSKLYTHLQTAAGFISTSLGGAGTEAISGGIIVYFSTLGFLGGYITTRLFLGAAFVRADRALSSAEKLEVENANINIEDVDASLTPKTKAIAEKIAKIPWKFVKVTDVPIWAKAKLITGEIREAVEAYSYLVRVDPTQILYRLNLSQALFENGNRENALLQAKEALSRITESTQRDLVDTCYKAVMYFALYVQPDGYKDTIDYANRFRTLPGKTLTAPMLVNLAAAYGQQAAKDTSAFTSAKSSALESSRKAIELDPIWKAKLKEMWRPASDAEDNDLAVFGNDQDFINLLG